MSGGSGTSRSARRSSATSTARSLSAVLRSGSAQKRSQVRCARWRPSVASPIVARAPRPVPDVDVGLGAEPRQLGFEARVLAQGLDEGADRELRRQVHLLEQLREPVGREARVDPGLVVVEVELRPADQEVVGAEAVERLEPALRGLEIARERLDVRRTRRHDAPAEDPDPAEPVRTHNPRCYRNSGTGTFWRFGTGTH